MRILSETVVIAGTSYELSALYYGDTSRWCWWLCLSDEPRTLIAERCAFNSGEDAIAGFYRHLGRAIDTAAR